MSVRFDNKNIIKTKGENLKILQLTDVHIGGSLGTRKRDKLALAAVEKIVKKAKPDFVVITGDMVYPMPLLNQGSFNNLKATKMLAKLMQDLGVEWTVVFGNHDSEVWARYSKNQLGDFYESLPSCHFEKGPKNLTGVGNHSIPIYNEDGTLNTVLMFVDSNAYLTWNFFSGFDVIHDDQIEWYKNTIKELSKDGEIARSIAFFHIPPKEFKDGWTKCYNGCKDVKYVNGFVQEKDNYFGYPKTVEGKFYGEMVKFGSCKAMFMGHDHLNTLAIEQDGMMLAYGMTIDYNAYKGIKKVHTQRGGRLIYIDDVGNITTELLPLDSCD